MAKPISQKKPKHRKNTSSFYISMAYGDPPSVDGLTDPDFVGLDTRTPAKVAKRLNYGLSDCDRSETSLATLAKEVDVASTVPSPLAKADEPPPIPPAAVRAGVEREMRALAFMGRTGPDALRDAIGITWAKIRNSGALAEHQAHSGRCHVCGEPLDDSLPMIAVLTGKPGSTLWLHAGCHPEHSRRMVEKVERAMAAAGYGADRRDGVMRERLEVRCRATPFRGSPDRLLKTAR